MRYFVLLFALVLAMASCKKQAERADATGWQLNDPQWGGYEKINYEGQVEGPNLVLIEGGTFTMGMTEQDVVFEWNNIPRRVTVSSFYMDETEVSNHSYRHYLHWLKNAYVSYPEVYKNALPDTLVWREELAYNEPYVETYLRHPSYDDYPVVGVSWKQASEYAAWRGDRVNEMLLIEKGILNPNPDQKDSDVFTSKSYLAGQYTGNVRKNYPDLVTGGERPIRFEDGILLPEYRLPTEAEWEYAALGLIGKQAASKDELITDKRIYPWDGSSARYKRRDQHQGKMMANFKKSGGDYMGMAGRLNDAASIPAPVRSYLPNDYGLYHMSGNVSEWVQDVYRDLTSTTLRDAENHDLNPFRGNKYRELIQDENGNPIEKDSLGRLQYKFVEDTTLVGRDNYRKGDVINYRDGDDEFVVYGYGKSSLVNNQSRVVKGGSWADRLYWLSPGTRRFKDEATASRTIGFRCAMVRVGGPTGNTDAQGQSFGPIRKTERRYK